MHSPLLLKCWSLLFALFLSPLSAYALVMATARMIANNRSASGRVTAFTNLTISKLGIPRLSWICSYFGVLVRSVLRTLFFAHW